MAMPADVQAAGISCEGRGTSADTNGNGKALNRSLQITAEIDPDDDEIEVETSDGHSYTMPVEQTSNAINAVHRRTTRVGGVLLFKFRMNKRSKNFTFNGSLVSAPGGDWAYTLQGSGTCEN